MYPTKNAVVLFQELAHHLALVFEFLYYMQVFGGLLSAKPKESVEEPDSAPLVEGEKDGEKEGDVREHVVDILFSKGNISGLQKQVWLF